MVDVWCLGARGEGDLGGLEDRGGASAGGSSAGEVWYEGVWLLDETCVTVGDTATSKVSVNSPASSSYMDRAAHRCSRQLLDAGPLEDTKEHKAQGGKSTYAEYCQPAPARL